MNQRTVMLQLEVESDAPVSFLRSKIARDQLQKALDRAFKGYKITLKQNIGAQVAQPTEK